MHSASVIKWVTNCTLLVSKTQTHTRQYTHISNTNTVLILGHILSQFKESQHTSNLIKRDKAIVGDLWVGLKNSLVRI